jgi:hypothetical protein
MIDEKYVRVEAIGQTLQGGFHKWNNEFLTVVLQRTQVPHTSVEPGDPKLSAQLSLLFMPHVGQGRAPVAHACS